MVDLKLKLPDGFLEEEVRCGYTVSAEMKKVWAVELDLLQELLRVCKKHGIRLFASGGTLLGAIRHHGFIPWDDDIDMMMMRDEYEKLCKIAPTEFRHPYFFQTEYTDPGSLRGHAQLRNSETTAILYSEAGKWQFNQGIFIDIFPLDSVVEDDRLFMKQYLKAQKYRNKAHRYSHLSTRYKKSCRTWKGWIKALVFPVVSKVIIKLKLEEKAYMEFEQCCQRYNDLETEMISTLSFQFNNKGHFKYRGDFNEIIYVPFEFIKIPVGKGYDSALRQRYGDYMQVVIGGSCHGAVQFDTEKAYTQYIL